MQECGDCDLCCKLLEIHDIPSPIGVYCQHCDKGCSIHETRPKECRDYQCMWSQMDNVGIELRPDQSGIIFDRMADDVISARVDGEISPLVEAQIQAFGREGFSVMVFQDRKAKGYLHPSHNQSYVMGVIRDRT